jgi:exonuclease VII small subunit
VAAERKAQEKADARKRAASESKGRGNARDIRRSAERAETRVTDLERQVAELDAALADPALYNDANGHAHAAALSRELAEAHAALAEALATWEDALAAAEALDAAT